MENPKQVIRYARNTKPLWLSSKFIPADGDIPPCENCGSEREFEFQVLPIMAQMAKLRSIWKYLNSCLLQILPQLLNYLNLDEDKTSTVGVFDWGTLAVYTCKNSCDLNQAYKTEFLWKQDLVE